MKVIKDLLLRFILGGAAVAVCYLLVQLIPWKSFSGIFAAFPAVMVAAVTMAGVSEGSKQAADIALGATAGMMGCTICVITATVVMTNMHNWGLALILSLLAWFISSMLFIGLIHGFMHKRKAVI